MVDPDWLKTSAYPQRLKQPFRDELGPYFIGWESCDCGGGYPCSHPDYPYQLFSTSRVCDRRGTPEFPELAVVANFSESEHTTHADAYLLSASWNLLKYVQKHAAEGNREAIELVGLATGEVCPECGEYSPKANLCSGCEQFWERYSEESQGGPTLG